MSASKTRKECAALRERAVVYDEITNERDRRPLSLEQLRQRLKHIAGLCWGLSIDIHNEIERNEALKSENKRLQDEINGLRAELKLLRNREKARGVYKRKTRATLEAQSNGETPAAPSKPKKEKPIAERTRKLNEKLVAMTPEEREKYLKQLEAKRKYNARYLAKKRAAQGGNNV